MHQLGQPRIYWPQQLAIPSEREHRLFQVLVALPLDEIDLLKSLQTPTELELELELCKAQLSLETKATEKCNIFPPWRLSSTSHSTKRLKR